MRCIRYKDMSGEYSVAKRKALICNPSIVGRLKRKRKIMREVNSLRNVTVSYNVESGFPW